MTAISKNRLKSLRALQLKKYRLSEGLFIAEGDKIVSELLNARGWQIEQIFALPTWINRHQNALQPYTDITTAVTETDMAAISSLHTPASVAALLALPTPLPARMQPQQWYIALDRLNDPGNMGTILRIADWFGIEQVFCSLDSVEVFNPKTIQAAMGSLWRVRVVPTNLAELFAQHPHIPVYGAMLQGDNLFDLQQQPTARGCIVIGSESHGIQTALQPYLQYRITIPRIGHAESLNAAVATGIICAQLCRS